MKASKYLTVNMRDFLWGLFYALVPAVVPIGNVLSSGSFPTAELLKQQAAVSIPIVAVYLVVHFFKRNR